MNVVFWHICEMNNWKKVILDQYNTLVSSGLMDSIDKCYIVFLGSNINNISWFIEKNAKLQLMDYSKNLHEYERLCLHSMLRWSRLNTANVLYIHAKGVSRPNTHEYKVNDNVWAWRKMMEYFLIEKYEICIDKLKDYDVVGCNLIDMGNDLKIAKENHKMHFSGNFWWSKTSYIKKLPYIVPSINDLAKNEAYLLCERWVLSPYPNTKVCEIYRYPYSEDKRFYYRMVRRSEYENAI